MKREFLKELGLTDEQIDKIMAENGKDIAREQEKTGEKDKEIELIGSQLKEANKTIKSYKDMDIDGIKKSANEWETKAKQLEKEKVVLKNDYALKSAIDNANSIDGDLLMKIINKEDLKFQDDKIIGLDEQIASIKESKPYLFKSSSDDGDDRFIPHKLPEGDSDGANAMESQISSVFDN
jgi:phage minor structural protein GP20